MQSGGLAYSHKTNVSCCIGHFADSQKWNLQLMEVLNIGVTFLKVTT
jgi:hypothetical protein